MQGLHGGGAIRKLVVECRALPDGALLQALGEWARRRGPVRVHLSPDFADPATRAAHKSAPVTDAELHATVERCDELGIGVEPFFILGLDPSLPDGAAALARAAAQLLRHPSVRAVRVHSVPLEPGAQLGEDPARYGLQAEPRTLSDYVALHQASAFPPRLGYAPPGQDPAGHARQVQRVLCERFCRIGNRLTSGHGGLRALLARASSAGCQALLARGG